MTDLIPEPEQRVALVADDLGPGDIATRVLSDLHDSGTPGWQLELISGGPGTGGTRGPADPGEPGERPTRVSRVSRVSRVNRVSRCPPKSSPTATTSWYMRLRPGPPDCRR